MLGSHQAVIRQLMSIRQAFVRQLSGSCQAIVKQSSNSHQAVNRKYSGNCQAVVKKLSVSLQAVKPELFLKRGTLLLFCATAYCLGLWIYIFLLLTFPTPFCCKENDCWTISASLVDRFVSISANSNLIQMQYLSFSHCAIFCIFATGIINSSFFWGPGNFRPYSQKVTEEATKPQRLGLFWQKKSRFVAACVLCTNLTRPPRLINLWQTLRLKKQALLLTTNTTASSVWTFKLKLHILTMW